MMKKVAVSACLMGEKCRYDASDNHNAKLLEMLNGVRLIPFCPEAYAFGTPRPTMDLIQTKEGCLALSNTTQEDLTAPLLHYAQIFFDTHPDVDLLIGKDRSPSCGVCSARLYDKDKNLLSSNEAGIMIQEAKKRQIPCMDAEAFVGLASETSLDFI